MRSLYAGVSGLKVHQTKMDVIGNNIANVNTVGFKAGRVTFSELFYQTTQSASGPNEATGTGGQNPKQIGLGAALATISTNITAEGGTQTTGNAFDIKINGGSFFVINSGGTNYFTKAGNFTTDAAGNLVTGSGAYVMGYAADRDQTTGDYKLQTDELRVLNVYGSFSTTAPAQTTEATFKGNISAEDEEFSVQGSGQITKLVYVYDNLGYQYGVQVAITKNSSSEFEVAATGNVYQGNRLLDPAEMTAQLGTGANTLTFDPTTGLLDIASDKQFELTMTGTSSTSFISPINVDFTDVTSYGSDTTIDAKRGTTEGEGAGKAVGNMVSVGIQSDGKVVAAYSNNDNVVIGQIAVASFDNPAGLEKMGDNLFAATLNSGDFNGIGYDITALGESFSTGTLEMSNVDLSTEFTDMIVTQRGFQANSRIITTSDSMIEELLSLKR